MSYRFKPWLDEHVTKLRDEHWPTNKEAGNKSSQSYRDLSSVQNSRCSRVVQSVRDVPHRGTVGWFLAVGMERAAVCVCVFQLGLGRDRSCQQDL